MIIHADLDAGTVTLSGPDDFKGFHVAVHHGAVDDRRLSEVLAPHARLEGGYAWVDVDAVEALAGDVDDGWRAGFAAMVAYARDKGFLSEDGTAIRAHLEPG